MAVNEKPGLPGKLSTRTDKNLSQRTQKIQRSAKIENASGGAYGQRAEMQSIASGAATETTASAVSAQPAPRPAVQVTGAFAPGSPNKPFTDGAGGNTPGASPDELMANYQSSDPGAILVRAMYKAYPTPELRRYVEAYNAEGLY